jgi:hypothetical protein
MKTILTSLALAGALGLSVSAGSARADDRPAGVRVGTLSCHEASGWGLIFGSSHRVRCIFSGGDHDEHYDGSISRFGVDVGYQHSGVIIWEVVAPTDHVGAGDLAGHYGGVGVEASAVIGAGANALVGGFKKSVALQPLSIEGTTGLNVAAGIGELTLTPNHDRD